MSEVVNIGVADSTVALPVDKKTLGEFISGLLGQPQTLERKFENSFSADHQWFLHFFSLVLQRIQQQNAPEPLAFEATIQYRDKLERKVTTWQAFQHFSETQNIVSIGAKFHLALLIQFPAKQIPERQELIISFDARDNKQSFVESLVGREPTVGSIAVEIRHTERTWADDILRLIETELNAIQVPEGRLKKQLRKLFFPLVSLLFPLMMFASVLYAEWSKRGARASTNEKILAVVNNDKPDLQNLHAKVDLLLAEATRSNQGKFGDETILIYSLLFAALVFFAGVFLARPNPSFVVLSPAAVKNRTETLERLKRKNLWLLISMIASVALGVIGNFVYDHIK